MRLQEERNKCEEIPVRGIDFRYEIVLNCRYYYLRFKNEHYDQNASNW